MMDVHEFDEQAEAAVKGWGEPYFADDSVTLFHGDALEVMCELPAGSVDCVVTSPPYYGLRDYGTEGQYGLEESPAAYVETMRALFGEVRRVLADDGTLWLNIGDSYSAGRTMTGTKSMVDRIAGTNLRHTTVERGDPGLPSKNLLGIPWRVAFALQDDGWILRNDIIWSKPNAMPESVTDRLSTKHEHLFMFAKQARYWFDLDPLREPLEHPDKTGHTFGGNNPEVSRTRGGVYKGARAGATVTPSDAQERRIPKGLPVGSHTLGRNPGDVWNIPTQPFSAAHFAVMPQALASRAIQAGCKPSGTVLDPFSGSGTTGLAAAKHGRKYVGIDLNADYLELSLRTRLAQATLEF